MLIKCVKEYHTYRVDIKPDLVLAIGCVSRIASQRQMIAIVILATDDNPDRSAATKIFWDAKSRILHQAWKFSEFHQCPDAAGICTSM